MFRELLIAASLVPLGAQGTEEEANDLLAKAESEAAKGEYAGAVRLYKSIAKRFPGTQASEVASKRAQPSAFLGWTYAIKSGPPSNRADIVLMGDGYELD